MSENRENSVLGSVGAERIRPFRRAHLAHFLDGLGHIHALPLSSTKSLDLSFFLAFSSAEKIKSARGNFVFLYQKIEIFRKFFSEFHLNGFLSFLPIVFFCNF